MKLVQNISLFVILVVAAVHCKPAVSTDDEQIDSLRASLERLTKDVQYLKKSVENKDTPSKVAPKVEDVLHSDILTVDISPRKVEAKKDIKVKSDEKFDDVDYEALDNDFDEPAPKEVKKDTSEEADEFDDKYYQSFDDGTSEPAPKKDVEEPADEEFDDKYYQTFDDDFSEPAPKKVKEDIKTEDEQFDDKYYQTYDDFFEPGADFKDKAAKVKQNDKPAANGKHPDRPLKSPKKKDVPVPLKPKNKALDQLSNMKRSISTVMKDFKAMKKDLESEAAKTAMTTNDNQRLTEVKQDLNDAMADFILLDAHMKKLVNKNVAKRGVNRKRGFSLTHKEVTQILQDMKMMLLDASGKIRILKDKRDAAEKSMKDSREVRTNAHQGHDMEDTPKHMKQSFKDELDQLTAEIADIKQDLDQSKKSGSSAHHETTEEKKMKGFYH